MTMFSTPSSSASPSPLQHLLGSVLRIVLIAGGMLLMLGALLLGLMLASGVVLWALLRGRRPGPVHLRWGSMPRPRGFGRRPAGEAVGAADADVVDAKVLREVEGPPPR